MKKIDIRKLPGKEAQVILKKVLDYDPESGVFTWTESRGSVRKGDSAGHLMNRGYIHIGVHGYSVYAHRLAWLFMKGDWPQYEIDHSNHIANDNSFKNLREVTRREQMNNISKPSNNTSGTIGVSFSKCREKWGAHIGIKGVKIYLGEFKEKEAAIEARKAAEIKYGFHQNHGIEKKPLLKNKINAKGVDKQSGKYRARVFFEKKKSI